MPPRKKTIRRKKATPASVGLSAAETRATGGVEVDRLAAQVEDDGGAVVGRYSDPFGGTPLLLAALPDAVEASFAFEFEQPHSSRSAPATRNGRG